MKRTMSRSLLSWLIASAVFVGVSGLHAQEDRRYDGPIIDMHMHASAYYLELGPDGRPEPFNCSPAPCEGLVTKALNEEDVFRLTLQAMDEHNVVLGYLSGEDLSRVERWATAAPGRFIVSAQIDDPAGVDIGSLRKQHAAGRLAGMGEIATQYYGYAPSAPEVAPFFALAAELDLPAHVHTAGIGAPLPGFRVSNGDPRLLEEVLARHPDLRLFNENCGFPFADEMIAMAYQYPQLHCDVSTITWIVHRQGFLDFLERLIRAGLGKRIMFGSDQMVLPETIGLAVESIQAAEFLSLEQKADIFYNNAARFLRLSAEQIALHKEE
jgi:hypothetical protein